MNKRHKLSEKQVHTAPVKFTGDLTGIISCSVAVVVMDTEPWWKRIYFFFHAANKKIRVSCSVYSLDKRTINGMDKQRFPLRGFSSLDNMERGDGTVELAVFTVFALLLLLLSLQEARDKSCI